MLTASLRPVPLTLIKLRVFQESSYCSPTTGEETKCQFVLSGTFTWYVTVAVTVELAKSDAPEAIDIKLAVIAPAALG